MNKRNTDHCLGYGLYNGCAAKLVMMKPDGKPAQWNGVPHSKGVRYQLDPNGFT